jgi:hypothetical protein
MTKAPKRISRVFNLHRLRGMAIHNGIIRLGIDSYVEAVNSREEGS